MGFVVMKKFSLEYENSVPPAYTAFRTVHNKRVHFDASYHLHPLCELTAMKRGFGKFVVEDIVHSIDDNHVSLVAPNVPHTYISDSECKRTEWYLLQFPIDVFSGLVDFSSAWNLFKNGEIAYIYDPAVAPLVRRHFLQMAGAKNLRRLSAFLELAQLFISADKIPVYSTSSSSSASSDRRVAFIENYIMQNYRDKISMSDLARRVGMDVAKMGRIFSKKKNISIKRFIRRQRILSICKEISFGDKSISEIAFANGYENLSNFNRQFLSQMGCTPVQYRKANNTYK